MKKRPKALQKQHLFLDPFLDSLGDCAETLLGMVLGGKFDKRVRKSIPKRKKCDQKTEPEKDEEKIPKKASNINLS